MKIPKCGMCTKLVSRYHALNCHLSCTFPGPAYCHGVLRVAVASLRVPVPVSCQVVKPAAEQLALSHELVEPLRVDVPGGGADQLPVPVHVLHLQPRHRRLQRAHVGLVRLVGLIEAENGLDTRDDQMNEIFFDLLEIQIRNTHDLTGY